MYYDASKARLRCVWMQSGRVVAYSSRRLKNHERSYPTHHMKLAAIIFLLDEGGGETIYGSGFDWRHL